MADISLVRGDTLQLSIGAPKLTIILQSELLMEYSARYQ